jgi:hypothetical protein
MGAALFPVRRSFFTLTCADIDRRRRVSPLRHRRDPLASGATNAEAAEIAIEQTFDFGTV